MSIPSKSVFYPLYSNPHHLAPQTHKITRSAIDVSDDEEDGSEGVRLPFERDDEGEQLLGHLLAGQWDQHPSTMDVDMDQGSESRNKRKAGNSEPSEDAGDEVFEFRLLSSSIPNKKIALHLPVQTFYVPNPRDAPVSETYLSSIRAQIEASCVNAAWVQAQSRLRHDAPPSHPPTPYTTTSLPTSTSSKTPFTPTPLPAAAPPPGLMVTSRPREPSTNPFSRHMPAEEQEERGLGAHLPCAQMGVERAPVATSSSSTYQAPEWFAYPSTSTLTSSESQPKPTPTKKKKKKTRPPTKKQQDPVVTRPMFYLPPAPTHAAPNGLGGKSRGYAYGYGAGRDELWGAEARGYVRDRMRDGWVGGGRGEGWWGKGGREWGEKQRGN